MKKILLKILHKRGNVESQFYCKIKIGILKINKSFVEKCGKLQEGIYTCSIENLMGEFYRKLFSHIRVDRIFSS